MAGAIGPRKKRSQRKKRVKHSVWQTLHLKRLSRLVNIALCKNCGTKKLSHRICKTCGWYKGEQVMTIKQKSSGSVIDA